MKDRKDKNISLFGSEMEFSSLPRKYEELGLQCPLKSNEIIFSEVSVLNLKETFKIASG